MRQQNKGMQDQLDAMQEELLNKGYEGMNYYLLYKQRFIVVHGHVIITESQVDV